MVLHTKSYGKVLLIDSEERSSFHFQNNSVFSFFHDWIFNFSTLLIFSCTFTEVLILSLKNIAKPWPVNDCVYSSISSCSLIVSMVKKKIRPLTFVLPVFGNPARSLVFPDLIFLFVYQHLSFHYPSAARVISQLSNHTSGLSETCYTHIHTHEH